MGSLQAWSAIAPLLQRGLTARVAPRASRFGATTFPAGTLYFLRRDNGGDADGVETLQAVYDSLRLNDLKVETVQSGFAKAGTRPRL